MARASLKKAKLGPKDCGSGEPHGKKKKNKNVDFTQKKLQQCNNVSFVKFRPRFTIHMGIVHLQVLTCTVIR